MARDLEYLDMTEEVAQALAQGRPVVALESTIISHGMPYPKNVETALAVEAEVRKGGAVPATIAIIDGRLKAGLTEAEIDSLGQAKDVIKTSRRDLAYVVSQGKTGGTTVGATMIIADLAGIQVFATGGVGGVHRNGENTMDISADLEELGRTNVVVVCAGAKAILDLGLTLEYLETQGVPVLGYQTKELPAFYTRRSGFEVDYAMPNGQSIAQLAKKKWEMGLGGGVLVTNPIPEEYSMDEDLMNDAIQNALKKAEAQGIHGKATTPFLLEEIRQITQGKSLEANIQLVLNNAKVAAEIALALVRYF